MEEETTTVIYSYNNDPNQPEETETVLSKNQSNSITKRYKGIWRKNGRWVARIRNPISNSREFLGKFGSCEAALSAYFKKKHEFEVLVRDVEVVDSVMIDNHGFLLGEFSRLDEDLRIFDLMPLTEKALQTQSNPYTIDVGCCDFCPKEHMRNGTEANTTSTQFFQVYCY
ncbi:ethylene-responsive transcription factor ERF118-like protein [Tanacetum coccineum]|uniref:Ethylene-responsive transcription factor ERF118-like protein n=1 Tax=Tanacetum coccineum TaxID=301880 RepID=A0ABQ5AXZ0_9ASTR